MSTHPAWCDLDRCDADDAGITHTSLPRTLRLGADEITLTLVQNHTFGEEPQRTEVHVDSPTGQHEWPADEVCDLAAALTGMYHRAHLLRASSPVGGAA